MQTLADRITEILSCATEPMLAVSLALQLGEDTATVNRELGALVRQMKIARLSKGDGLLRYTISKLPPPKTARLVPPANPSHAGGGSAQAARKPAPKQDKVLAALPRDGSSMTVGEIRTRCGGVFTADQVSNLLQLLRAKGLVRSALIGQRGPGTVWARSVLLEASAPQPAGATAVEPVVAEAHAPLKRTQSRPVPAAGVTGKAYERRLQGMVVGVQQCMAATIEEACGAADTGLLAKLVAANSLIADAAVMLERSASR